MCVANHLQKDLKLLAWVLAEQSSGVGFSRSWLEIPGNVIYITSQSNHSARNPSS